LEKKMKNRFLAVVACCLLSFVTVNRANATVLTFDDYTVDSEAYPVTSYGGFTWDNMGILDGVNYGAPSGYQNGVVSGNYVAYNGYGYPITVSSDTPFTFVGAYFTSAWYNENTVILTGYLGGVPLYQDSFIVNTYGPTWASENMVGIDTLNITTTLEHVAIDNFTTPEPSTVMLLGISVFGLSYRNRRKAAVAA
jgi:hypothetical protein